jgi:hypothetical protein
MLPSLFFFVILGVVHFAHDSYSRVIGSNRLISGPSFGSVSIFLFLRIKKRP